MKPHNFNNQSRLTCHKHGEAPYLIVDVPDQPPKYRCLVCLEDAFVRLGVHAMFPVADQAKPADEFPEAIELN